MTIKRLFALAFALALWAGCLSLPGAAEDPDAGACVCENLCTEDSVNTLCPVCGGEAGIAACTGGANDAYGTGSVVFDVPFRPWLSPTAEDFSFFAPEDLIYNGSEKVPVFTTDRVGMGAVTLRYQNAAGEAVAAPIEAGSYRVLLDVAAGVVYADAEGLTREDWCFTIEKAPVSAFDLTALLPAPEKGQAPYTALTHSQYTGCVVWEDEADVFLGNTAYTAQVTLTPTANYRFADGEAPEFLWMGAALSAQSMGGNVCVSLTFPATAPAEMKRLQVSAAPAKTVYDIGEEFDPTGMLLVAVYDDGTTSDVPEGLTYEPRVIQADTAAITVSLGSVSTQIPITVKDALKAIVSPAPIGGLTNGTAKTCQALGLPDTVELQIENGSTLTAPVQWDLSGCGYIPADPGAQSFTVRGSVTVPEGLSNRNQVSTEISVEIAVEEAHLLTGFPQKDTSPGSTDTDEAVSGIQDQQEFSLGSSLTISLQTVKRGSLAYLPAKWSTNPNGYFEDTGGGYRAVISTEGMSPGDHVLKLFYQETDAATGLATGNTVVSELSYTLRSIPTTPTEATVPSYVITVSAGEGGKAQPDGRIQVSGGSSVTVRLTPEEGYVIDDVLVDSRSIGPQKSYTFKEVWANHTVQARFRASDEETQPTETEDLPFVPLDPPLEHTPTETLPYPTLPDTTGSPGNIPIYIPFLLLGLAIAAFTGAFVLYRRQD